MLIFCSAGRTGLFGLVSVALSCCWFSKLTNGMLTAKSSGMSRMRQPPSKDKLVAAAELSSIKPNSKQRKADLSKVRAGGPLDHWAIRSLVHWPTRSDGGNAMSYLAIMPNPFLEILPKRAKRARKLLRKAKRRQAKRYSKRR